MKHYPLLILSAFLFLFSCRKQSNHPADNRDYLENVQSGLKNSLSSAEYERLDFSQPVLTRFPDASYYLLRIPFTGKSITRDFMLLQTSVTGQIENARIIHLEPAAIEQGNRSHLSGGWNGYIAIYSLSGQALIRSEIMDGYIKRPYKKTVNTDSLYTDRETPEVLVVSSMAQPGVTWSEWMSLVNLFGGSSGISGSPVYGWYSNLDPYASGGSGGGSTGGSTGSGGSNPGGVVIDDPIQIDFETGFEEPAIDIEKYMQCFSHVPDEGATGFIEIFTDIPVDGDPTKIFNFESGSPGHTFIQLRKINGSQSVCQNIGFYPKRRPKAALTAGPIEGKFVDNRYHEFNASLKIEINAAQVNAAVTHILYLARFVKYDIDQYNCTDWALDVFNHTVHASQQLNVPLYDLPGGVPLGSHIPQGLYIQLKELKDAGGPLADNITIPIIGYTGTSDGPCN